MDATAVLPIVVYATALVVLVIVGWGVVQVAAAARSARRLTDELHSTVPGVLRRVDDTLTAFNAELVRMDGVVTQFEEVSDRVASTTRSAQEIVEAPRTAVTRLARGARRFFEVLFSTGS